MSSYKPGDRIIAVESISNGKAVIYGAGVYDGNFEPPVAPFGVSRADFAKVWKSVHGEDSTPVIPPNPRMTLDDGQVVWGMQCWWGDEKKMLETLSKCKTVETVKVPVLQEIPLS